MFKLESYITPIILSYVDKYVKNARADKSQVSLWGGDVVFSNLDLRLDVLEKELALPFTLVSGHIHELHINVPWTRLNTEPIVITINTIEIVFRLPDSSSASQDGSETSSVKSAGEKRKSRRQVTEAQQSVPPPGYVQSLINKIISNVKIVCNNLILKYVEDDIVLSLNTRWLCLAPANAFWEPAFVEFGLPDLVIRKVLQVKDMTVCLDRRDASGRIDTYQEPFLYRCFLTVHAAWVYESLTNKVPKITRYDIRTARMEFSLTDTQLPMFLRIVKLVLALYYGDLADKDDNASGQESKTNADFTVDMSGIEEHERESRHTHESSSWSGWAWNVGSSVGTALLPIYWEDEDEDDDDLSSDKTREGGFDPWRDKVTHIGLYVDEASFTFKLTEKLSKAEMKSSNTPARLVFTPLLRLHCTGCYLETRGVGVHTVNVGGGISSIALMPLGDCACGERDTLQLHNNATENTDSTEQPTTSTTPTAQPPESHFFEAGDLSRRSFLKGSLFEKDFGDEEGTCKERKTSYDIQWDKHVEQVTEDTMLERTPGVALDMLYHLELPEDANTDDLSAISDLESSELGERALTRLVFGPCQIRLCSGAHHRMSCILHFLANYDYPPYSTKIESAEYLKQSSPMPTEDSDTKVRIYQLTVISPSVSIFAADHPALTTEECLRRRWHCLQDPSLRKPRAVFTDNLSCQLVLDCIDSQIIVPMYLAKVPCLDEPNNRRSYASANIKLMQLSSRLMMQSLNQGITWLQPSNIFFKGSHLLVNRIPDALKHKTSLSSGSFEIDAVKLRLSRPQWLLLLHIYSTWNGFEEQHLPQAMLQDAMTRKLPNLLTIFKGFQFAAQSTQTALTFQTSCQDFLVSLGNVPNSTIPLLSTTSVATSQMTLRPMTSNLPHPASPGRAQNRRSEQNQQQSWFRLELQWPTSPEHYRDVLPLCFLQTGEMHVNFDPKLGDWIGYRVETAPKAPSLITQLSLPIDQRSSTSGCSKKRKSRSVSPRTGPAVRSIKKAASSQQAPTLCQSTKTSTQSSDMAKAFLTKWFDVFNAMLMQVQIDPVTFFAPRKSLAYCGAGSKLSRRVQDAMDQVSHLTLELPTVILENVAHKPMIQQFLNVMPFALPESLWSTQRDNLPWTLKLNQFSITSWNCSSKETILEAISTSCTLGLTAKSEGFAICIHADMTPLKVTLTDEQLGHSIAFLERSLQFSASLFPDLFNSANVSPTNQPKHVSFPTTDTEKSYAVKMRGHSTTMSSHSFDQSSQKRPSMSEDEDPLKLASDVKLDSQLSVWVQWTLPLASLSLLTGVKQKLVFVLEDYQSSFDWNPVYFQAKLRVLSASIKHHIASKNKNWTEGPNHGLIMTFGNEITSDLETVQGTRVELLSTERTIHLNKTCFTLIFTRAECSHLHAKWREANKSSRTLPSLISNLEASSSLEHQRFLCEVDVKVAPIDLILDIETFLPFTKMMARLMNVKWPGDDTIASSSTVIDVQTGETLCQLNNNTLPLVYLRMRTLRIFLPSHHQKTADSVEDSDFVLCHCESIDLSPQVDNPVSRILVRPEIYHRWQPALDIPGSPVENRQYQLNLQGLGLFTGSWKDVVRLSQAPERPAELKTISQNPALEWNIATDNNMRKENIILLPLLKKFDMQIIAAPAIVLYNGPQQTADLVAGHSFEINAQTDITLTASMGQLHLCSLLMQEALAAVSVLNFKATGVRGNSSEVASLPISSDSGVESFQAAVQQKPEAVIYEAKQKSKIIPVEVLLTGRAISVSFHQTLPYNKSEGGINPSETTTWRKLKLRSFRRSTLSESLAEDSDTSSHRRHQTKYSQKNRLEPPIADVGYEASEEGSIDEGLVHSVTTVRPLLHCSLMQPHIFLTCSASNQKLEISIYDQILSLPGTHHFITCSGGRCLPTEQDYTRPVVQTRPGELSRLSGIPPALFTLTATDFLDSQAKIMAKFERPFKLNLSPQIVDSLQRSIQLISQSLAYTEISQFLPKIDPPPAKQQQDLERKTWLQKKVSSLVFTTAQIVATSSVEDCGESHALQVGFYASSLKISPKSLVQLSSSLTIQKLVARTVKNRAQYHRLLGPWNLDLNSETFWTNLQDEWPVVTMQLHSQGLILFVGRESLQSVNVALNQLIGEPTARRSADQQPSVSTSFNVLEAGRESPEEQHYMDDLRAGAFHFIEKGKIASQETKPYQVVFTDSPMAMTWAYPRPRTIARMTIFPVPFIRADVSRGQEETMECSLEYWDKCLKSFQIYGTFQLSENSINHLDLPLINDNKRVRVSETWRVVLHYHQSDDENVVIVKPQSLVSVIRVDSFYNPKLIPRFQASVRLDQVKISLVNQTRHLPSMSSKVANIDQELAAFVLDGTVVGADCWLLPSGAMKVNGRMKSQFRVTCVDFALLANHHIIMPCRMSAHVYAQLSESKRWQVDQHVRLHRVVMKTGHFVHDALRNIETLWEGEKKCPADGLTAVTIHNCTHNHMRIGQADTDESLMLPAHELIAYVWRSQKARLMIRCSTESAIQIGSWRWSEPFSLREGVITARVQHDGYCNTIVVTMKKLSATKHKIFINGLISVASLLRESLETRIILKRNYSFLANLSETGKDDIRSITKGNSVTDSHLLDTDYVHALKIRFLGIGTPWSGDIPFESTRRDSVLVKIPSKDRGKCVTVWCRLLQETMGDNYRRCLFVLSPMFMARSLLPNPLTVLIQPNKVQSTAPVAVTEMTLDGGDQPVTLETNDSPDTKYLLSFKVSDQLPASEPFLLSWGIIEQVKDKDYKVPSIDEAIQGIKNLDQKDNRWPYVDNFTPANVLNDQPKTDVQVTLAQFHPLCNTICADINPWCLLVNELDMPVFLKLSNEHTFEVQSRSVLVPPSLIDETFYFGIGGDDEEPFYSQPLRLTDQEWHFQSLMPSLQGLVPMEGVCHCKVIFRQDQCLFTIRSKSEHGIRVMTIQPTIFLVNEMLEPINVASLCVFGRYNLDLLKYFPQEVGSQKSSPLLFWQMLGPKTDGLFDGFQHLAFSMADTMWSELLNLEDCRHLTTDQKKTVSLQRVNFEGLSNRLLVLTLHQREGQVFMVLHEDIAPKYIIHNNLKDPVVFTTTPASSNKKVKPMVKWTSGDVFKVPAGETVAASACVPINSMAKVENLNALSYCHFTAIANSRVKDVGPGTDWEVVSNETSTNSWSDPLDIADAAAQDRDHFMSIPGHGEAIVRIEKSVGRVHIFLDPFSASEISAKDVRGRIVASSSSDDLSDSGGSFCTLYSPMNASRRTEYHSAMDQSCSHMVANNAFAQFCLSLLCDQISLVVTDDCVENTNQVDEYVRVTLDTVVLTLRPQTVTRVLRSQDGRCAALSDLCLTVGQLQIDNQMHGRGAYDFPVILKGRETDSRSALPDGLTSISSQILDELNQDSQMCVQLQVELGDTNQYFIKDILVRIQPMDLYIEDVFVYKLTQVLKTFSESSIDSSLDHVPPDVRIASRSLASPVVLENLLIQPINVLVSLHASVKAFVGLDQSPLQFGKYHRQFVQTTFFALGQNVARHYISGTLFRAGWVVGSLEMIGSPAGLTRAVGDGIRDFVAMPYHGILNGPWAFLRGVTHGSSSLVKHVSAGTLTSVTNFASSVSRNLDRLSLDSEHCQRNELARRSLPQGIGHGFMNGLSGIGISILGAVGGLAHHPIKSLIEQGASPTGLMGGLTRGLMGVVTKPLGGAAEFVAQTGQGLLIGSGWAQKPSPKELSMPEPICALTSSALKYEWKLECGPIVIMAEVTMEKDGMIATSLILTSEAIILVGDEEDAQDRIFAIVDVEIRRCDEDPTRFELIPLMEKKSSNEQEDITNERIVQFVLESGGGGTLNNTNNQDEKEDEKLVFYADSTTTVAFYDAFQVAKAHLRRFGFPILM